MKGYVSAAAAAFAAAALAPTSAAMQFRSWRSSTPRAR